MKRTYIATIDNGRDYIDFVFYSEHKANSIANYTDARDVWKHLHGYRPRVIRTWLAKDCDLVEGTQL